MRQSIDAAFTRLQVVLIESSSDWAAIAKSLFLAIVAGGQPVQGRTVKGVLTAVAGSPAASAPTSMYSPDRRRPA